MSARTPRYLYQSSQHRGSHVIGYIIVEGPRRADAIRILKRLAAASAGAASEHARAVLAAPSSHRLRRLDTSLRLHRQAYAAHDGAWRGWADDDWTVDPPRAYARWAK
jgi:hypothetical protein